MLYAKSCLERAERAGEVCACELREILKMWVGKRWPQSLTITTQLCRQILDFSFGLVNDRNGNEFGQASEQFRFRLFSDLEFKRFFHRLCPATTSQHFQNLMFLATPTCWVHPK